MLYQTLFKKNNSKNIIKWEIHYDSTSYWTEYGIIDGKIITTKPTLVNGKNIGKKHETSIGEQIIKEMDSLIKYKLDSDGYHENVDDVNIISDKLAPMLANKFDTYKEELKFIQPKLDGIRCLINCIENYSRKFNNFKTIEHIEKDMEYVFKMYPSITFDGELYNNDLSDNFNKIVSLVKKNKPTYEEIVEIENNIEYHVYDMFDKDNPDMPFHDRCKAIQHILRDMQYVKVVETEPISSQEDIDKWFNYFTSIGYEGAIVRSDGKYEHKRSKNLLKYKEFLDTEYKVLDVVSGDGNRSDIAAKFILQDNNSPQTFKAAITGTFDYCKELILNKEIIIGKLATIKYFCLTPKTVINGVIKGGVPRFGSVVGIRDYE